ncbi:DUF461 domain-containing protein [uncultured Streptomyces sp.]|uniref:DUF461 domain-containing protein n=1 Tax=uncultured Streptomyces sp. TaxID=174707 RepID=UPI0026236BAA|nr:DUF461 domain-containing protein [uncultured Streptomyces sp.]
MSRSLRHGALAATALVVSIVSLTACGAGNDAQTLEVKPDNAATSVGTIKIQNVNVITQPEHDAEGPAVVAATLFNGGTKAETLQSVELPGSDAPVELHAAKGDGPIEIPAGGRVIIGGEGNASAVIENGREATRNGNVQSVVFHLSETGEIQLGATVVPATGFFEGFGPSALPSAAGSPSPSASESADASATPDATTSESASPDATGSESAAE